jgi:hypothetical protein
MFEEIVVPTLIFAMASFVVIFLVTPLFFQEEENDEDKTDL